MMTSQRLVSWKTFGLTFAIVLSPALMQTGGGCPASDTSLSVLELEIYGANWVELEQGQRVYSVEIPSAAETAILRVATPETTSTITYAMAGNFGRFEFGVGEVTLALPPEPEITLRITVQAWDGSTGYYTLNLFRTAQPSLPCTEQGIRRAIALGGGPHALECDGPTTVIATSEITIGNDVILDGEGILTIEFEGSGFAVTGGAPAALRHMTLGHTGSWGGGGGGWGRKDIGSLPTISISNATLTVDALHGPVDIAQARAAEQPFVGYPLETLTQLAQNFELHLVFRREADMPALGHHRVMVAATAHQPGDTQARTWTDHGDIEVLLAPQLLPLQTDGHEVCVIQQRH